MTETESRPRHRALVASFLFTDLVGYSKGTASDQYAAKEALSEILRRNLAALSPDDYRIKDTGDGALIAFLVNPEHALYMALAIAHDFGRAASGAGFPSNSVRTGLHIGAVKEAIDLEARPNFVGDGINAAKRIMDFAVPGQITASRAYFEAVSWLDSVYAALFQHLGAPDDKHGRPHELYAIAPSDVVLEKLRLDLSDPAQDASRKGGVAAPRSDNRDRRSSSVVDGARASSPERAGRQKWLLPAAIVGVGALVAAMASVIFPLGRGDATSSSVVDKGSLAAPPNVPNPPRAMPAAVTPEVKSPPAVAQPGSDGPMPPSPSQPVADAYAAPTSVRPTSNMTETMRKGAAARAVESKSAAASSPVAAPIAEGSATAPLSAAPASASPAASGRCRHILEKVQIGEPLSPDEKRELASTCR